MNIYYPSRRLDYQHNKHCKFVPFCHQVTDLSPLNSELVEFFIASSSLKFKMKRLVVKAFPFLFIFMLMLPGVLSRRLAMENKTGKKTEVVLMLHHFTPDGPSTIRTAYLSFYPILHDKHYLIKLVPFATEIKRHVISFQVR